MKKIKKYLNLFLGLFLAALSFSLFLSPFNIASGGVGGLSLIICSKINVNKSLFILIINIILLITSYFTLGKKVTQNTIIGSLLFPFFISICNTFTKNIDIDVELLVIAILGGTLSGIGYGLIFKSGFTSGGTDIINQIMEKYFRMPISKSIIFVDGLITLSSVLVFGFSTMLYSFISLLLISIFSNKQIIGVGNTKTIFIYSKNYQDIKKYLHEELKIDSTDFDIKGGFASKKSKMLMTVIKTRDYYKIRESIRAIDPKSFITVTDSYFISNANVNIRK